MIWFSLLLVKIVYIELRGNRFTIVSFSFGTSCENTIEKSTSMTTWLLYIDPLLVYLSYCPLELSDLVNRYRLFSLNLSLSVFQSWMSCFWLPFSCTSPCIPNCRLVLKKSSPTRISWLSIYSNENMRRGFSWVKMNCIIFIYVLLFPRFREVDLRGVSISVTV